MSGIAGIASASEQQQVKMMLDKLPHRGQAGTKIIEQHEVTLGAVWPEEQVAPVSPTLTQLAAWDGYRPPLPDPGANAIALLPICLTLDDLTNFL